MLKWFSKTRSLLILSWVFISILLVFCISLFRINDYVNTPQHGIFADFDNITTVIENNGKIFLYRIYFVLDLIWAGLLLAIIGNLLKGMDKKRLFSIGIYEITLYRFFLIFAILAFNFDILEGFCYISSYWIEYLKTITDLKVSLYILSFAFFTYWLLKNYIISSVKSILRFIKTSSLSLFFILVVYALITLMPQGGTLIVDLFYNPLNILLFFFLLTFLAIILSHYPVYVDIWANADEDCVRLKMGEKGFRKFGFGIIYYDSIKNNTEKVKAYNNKKVISLRRSLGILLYVAIFNIFLEVTSRFFEIHFNALAITLFILAISLTAYYLMGEEYIKWNQDLKSDDTSDNDKKETVIKIVNYVKWFPSCFIAINSLIFITALVSYYTQWSRISLALIFITLVGKMFLYMFFRVSRSYLKYVFYSEKLKEFNSNMFDNDKLNLFKKYDLNSNRRKSWLNRQFGMLSDNIRYLQVMQISGYLAFILLLISNFNYSFAENINPLNIILLYIILFYSVIIIVFKHVLYYSRCEKALLKYKDFFRFGIPVFTIIFLMWAIYSSTLKNDLHELQLVKQQNKTMDYREFLNSMTSDNNAIEKDNYFFVGSYGGGLKANLWNLLLLHELEKTTHHDFLKRTIAMSGVSGGAVGIGNYASLIYEQENSTAIKKQINTIGNSNVLSNELVYLLGKDWVREYIPYLSYQGTDRSYKSMQQHAFNTGMGSKYNTIGYSDYWQKIFNKQKGKFPALIMNTTSVAGKQGVACTVQFPKNTFPAADYIAKFQDNDSTKTLTYFGAVSTTNRFPLFSPTAKIKGKGSYLDGGYFENSGMLSVLEVYNAIAGDPEKEFFQKINPVFINIINSEDYYIAKKIEDWKFKKENLSDAGEFSSIIGTVASIDKLPRYVFEKIIAQGFAIEPIMMPHKITYEKVKNILKADIDEPVRLMDSIKAHNNVIDEVLINYNNYHYYKWGVVQPPLARLLSMPAVRYQEAMVTCHPDVRNALKRIHEYVKTDTTVTREMQENLMFFKTRTENLKKKRTTIKKPLMNKGKL